MVRVLIKVRLGTESQRILWTKKTNDKCSYLCIINTLAEEGSFVLKLFPLFFDGLQCGIIVECNLHTGTGLNPNGVMKYF